LESTIRNFRIVQTHGKQKIKIRDNPSNPRHPCSRLLIFKKEMEIKVREELGKFNEQGQQKQIEARSTDGSSVLFHVKQNRRFSP